jgi:hypothetical protein
MSSGVLAGVRAESPQRDLSPFWWHVRNWLQYRWRELPLFLFLCCLPLLKRVVPGLCVWKSELRLRVIRADGTVINLGVAGQHLVVTAGKNFVASAFDNTVEPELLHFHGFGSGATAAAAGDTTLQTEYTTQYATDSTRPTGSQAHSTNTYTTVATFTPDAAVSPTEWGLFSATSAGTLFDRQTYTAVGLNGTGDSLQTTYVLTLS